MAAGIALALAAPAAAPPKLDAAARMAFTFRIQDHGITLRTVRFQRSSPLDAATFKSYLKHGYWGVGFLGKDLAGSKLCGLGSFCSDLEPGHLADGAFFNNLSVRSSNPSALQHMVVLDGSIAITKRGSITDVSPDYNLCYSGCSSPSFLISTGSPIAVAAGQHVRFTIEISLTLKHG